MIVSYAISVSRGSLPFSCQCLRSACGRGRERFSDEHSGLWVLPRVRIITGYSRSFHFLSTETCFYKSV